MPLMVVTSLMIAVGYWSDCTPVLEQPSGSAMPKCEPLCSVLRCIGSRKYNSWLGTFGGASPKPLQLWCHRDLSALQRGRPLAGSLNQLVSEVTTRKGRTYNGKKKALKSSQAYPQLGCLKADV
jgi:hypothetical protein